MKKKEPINNAATILIRNLGIFQAIGLMAMLDDSTVPSRDKAYNETIRKLRLKVLDIARKTIR